MHHTQVHNPSYSLGLAENRACSRWLSITLPEILSLPWKNACSRMRKRINFHVSTALGRNNMNLITGKSIASFPIHTGSIQPMTRIRDGIKCIPSEVSMVPLVFIIAISIDRGIEFAGVFYIESKSHTISSLNSPGEYLCTCKIHVVNFLETTWKLHV